MRRQGFGFTAVFFAALTMTTCLFAADPTPPPATPQAVDPAASSAPVSREDYLKLQRELDQMKQRLDAQDRRLAAATQPVVPETVRELDQMKQRLDAQDQRLAAATQPVVPQAVKTLFAAPTENKYFSDFDIMNPAHMRSDMPMQIGQYQDMSLYIGLQTVGRVQALQQHNVFIPNSHAVETQQAGLNPGFQDPYANLSFLASIPNKMDVYADLYISSKPHASTTYGHEGYIVLKQLPGPFDTSSIGNLFNSVNVKAGAFDIDFGDDNYRRSNNARVQRNPLIDNPLVDPNVEEIGGEVYSVKGPVYGLFGIGSGTTTEHFDYGAQPSIHGKIWAYPRPDLRTSISAYYVDLGGSADTSYLYTNGRSGGALAGIFGDGDNPGQILPQAGKKVTAVQGDVTWNHWPFEVYSNVGWTQDADTNGSAAGAPAERWLYGTVEPVYHISPALYVAGRYSCAMAESVAGVPSDGRVDRFEVGGGYWFTQSILAKVEYIYERYHDFSAADGFITAGGVQGSPSPRFSGVVLEVSFSL